MIDLLIILLKPALLCTEAKKYQYFPFALVAWVVDMIIAHTSWALIAGRPQKSEWTISQTLERLCNPSNSNHPDFKLFVAIGEKINKVSPTKNHIKILS